MLFEVSDEKILKHFPYEEIRPQQLTAIRKILLEFANGVKHVILEAPTGVGKSAIGITVARYMNEAISLEESSHRTVMSTVLKYLQGQYRRDFPFMKDIRNAQDPKYLCKVNETKGTEGCIINRQKTEDECVKACPYRLAMLEFRRGPISITNAHYIANAPFKFHLAVFDECHELANVIASQAELRMASIDVTKLSLIFRGDTDYVMDTWSKVAKFVAEIEDKKVFDFMNTEFLLDLNMELYQERVEALAGQDEFKSVDREFKKFKNNISKALLISEAKMVKVIENDHTSLRPIYAREFAPSMLFTKAQRFLHMSATVCGFEGYARELGIENDNWVGIEVDHAIDAERRKVFFEPVAWMSAKNEARDIENTVKWLDTKLEEYENANTIIHSASYRRAEEFARLSKHRIEVPRNAQAATDILKENSKGKFVASPSLAAGIDAKDDMCRLVVVSKVPYPSFGDPRIAYIAKHNPEILNQHLVRTIVQACGRGTRHEKDFSHAYIIDGCFERLLNDWSGYFPKFFMEALER